MDWVGLDATLMFCLEKEAIVTLKFYFTSDRVIKWREVTGDMSTLQYSTLAIAEYLFSININDAVS